MSSAPTHEPRPRAVDGGSVPYEEAEAADLRAPRRGPSRDASLSDLISRLGDDVTLLFRQEVELAKVEIKQEMTAVAKASGMLAAAGLLALVTVFLLAWALAWGLAAVMPTGWAFLIVAVLFGAGAAALGLLGKKRFEALDLTPRATIQTLQEDREWLSDRTNERKSA
jgi:uncharacterized membrane protein YqjE